MPPAPPAHRFTSAPDVELYIEELQGFFGSRQVSSGHEEDLPPFALRLRSDPSFAEETASMLRSILYREAELVGAADLCHLLVEAVAGRAVQQQDAGLRAASEQVLAFVTESLRSGSVPSSSDAVSEDSIEANGIPPAEASMVTPSLQPPHPERNQPAAPDLLPLRAVVASRASSLETGINQRLSEMLFSSKASAAEDRPEDLPSLQREAATQPEAPMPQVVAPFAKAEDLLRQPSFSGLQRLGLFVGLCALLAAAAAAGWFWQRTRQSHAEQQPTATITHVPPAGKSFGHANLDAPTTHSKDRAKSNAARGMPRPGILPITPRSKDQTNLGGSSHRLSPTPSSVGSGDDVFLTSSGTMASHLVYAPAPGYPRIASMMRSQGQVVLQVTVTRSGSVGSTRVISGPRLLRRAAEQAVHRWHYRPFLVGGQATDVSTMVTVTFRLQP